MGEVRSWRFNAHGRADCARARQPYRRRDLLPHHHPIPRPRTLPNAVRNSSECRAFHRGAERSVCGFVEFARRVTSIIRCTAGRWRLVSLIRPSDPGGF